MTMPLIILAAATVLLSIVGTPLWPWFHAYLTGHRSHLGITWNIPSDVWLIMLVSICIVAAGVGLAWWLYGRKPVEDVEQPDPLEELQPGLFSFVRAKFFIDEIYEATIGRLTVGFARACHWLDRVVLDGLVQVISYLVLVLAWFNRLVDEFVVNPGFDKGCNSLRISARLLSFLQNGQVQRYLRVLGLALVIFALIFIWGCR